MYSAWKQGQIGQAQRLMTVVARLTTALSSESNPAPVKYALSLFNIMSPRVRLPLVELRSETKAEIHAALAQACEGYSDYMIGKAIRHDDNAVGTFKRVQPKGRFTLGS
jgi:dihydrodipicolinate synthase/N-acetylneuraminate lyase